MKDISYEDMRAQTGPVASLLEAVIRVNYHADAARDAGWNVTLTVNDIESLLGVSVDRHAEHGSWLTPVTDDEAA